jgi:hypothetical protein
MTFTKQHKPAHSAAPRNPSPATVVEAPATTSAGSDKERVNELNAKVNTYQNKTAADRLEAINMADIVLTSQNEANAVSGLRRFDGAASGVQQPRKTG